MTAIEWTHRPGTVGRVWNPVTGCRKVSEGCRHCYAETMANRFWPTQYPEVTIGPGGVRSSTGVIEYARPRRFTDVLCHENRLAAPLSWRKPSTVFVNSMSDLFHEAVPDAFIDQVFAVMALCQEHTFLVLTKRPERMQEYSSRGRVVAQVGDVLKRVDLPLPNVWLGVSVEDQGTADARIPLLLQTPAAQRFVSAEPLLGPVDISRWTRDCHSLQGVDGCEACALGKRLRRPDWLIIGGESGSQARPCDVAWIRSLVSQATGAGVPCFVKQLGAFPLWRLSNGALANGPGGTAGDARLCGGVVDRKGGDPAEWPVDLRVREWPEVTR